MSPKRLILLYTAFAVLATFVNLGTQRLVLAGISGTVGLGLAMFFGTLAGLVVKYILDKRWIFDDRQRGVAVQSRQFSLYTAMGIVTTAIFWASESAFWMIWRTDLMREIGAVLGLAVGYIVKYQLDNRFVFTRGAR